VIEPPIDLALAGLGWTGERETAFSPLRSAGCRPGRVVIDFGADLAVRTAAGEERAQLSAALYRAARGGDRVVVGDWVALQGELGKASIVERLARDATFSRLRPGADASREQVIAANVDTAFIVTHARDFNARRLERYLALVAAAGAEPAIVFTKIDLYPREPEQWSELAAVAPGVPVYAVSSETGEGFEEFQSRLEPGRTVCLLGSSGVGKSTLLNRLLGRERLATSETRRDGRGRHTTTHRELVPLSSGALLIDNPGMREVGLWDAEEGIEEAFADVSMLADECRFRDCDHEREPGCAVREAVRSGRLARERLASFRTLALEHSARRDLRFAGRGRRDVRR
jgi:ribosome biogenesis GTPase